jgi:hypothetical protein
MFAFADVVYLFPHEFSSLRRGCFAFARVLTGALQSLLFRHDSTSWS